MERRSIALAAIAVGVVMILIALLADTLGIGEEGFGWRRGLFLAVGVVVALAGLAYLLMPPRATEGEEAGARSGPGDEARGRPAPGEEAGARPAPGDEAGGRPAAGEDVGARRAPDDRPPPPE